MLTKDDLENIRGVVRNEVKAEISDQLGTIKNDMGEQLKRVEKRLSIKIHKIQNSLIQYHDEYALFLRGRIERLEKHTGILKSNKN